MEIRMVLALMTLTRLAALKRERQLKRWTRAKKEAAPSRPARCADGTLPTGFARGPYARVKKEELISDRTTMLSWPTP